MVIRLSESKLNRIIKESVRRLLKESRYMSDEDISSQYSGMKIIDFSIEPLVNSDGWKGVFELEFPNADGIDYNNTMVNNFIVYDKEGFDIAWDNWMPDEETNRLEQIIRQEIHKTVN